MELLQLKYFCDAAKEENLSKTARKFHVPTSNISNAIKRLEGIKCGMKSTSCPDQLAQALKECLAD